MGNSQKKEKYEKGKKRKKFKRSTRCLAFCLIAGLILESFCLPNTLQSVQAKESVSDNAAYEAVLNENEAVEVKANDTAEDVTETQTGELFDDITGARTGELFDDITGTRTDESFENITGARTDESFEDITEAQAGESSEDITQECARDTLVTAVGDESEILQFGGFPKEGVSDETRQLLDAMPAGKISTDENDLSCENATELTVRKAIIRAAEKRKETVDVSVYNIKYSKIPELVKAIMNENPQLYRVKHYKYAYWPLTGITSRIVFEYYTEDEVSSSIFEEEVGKCMAVVTPEMTDFEKALAVHDYIVEHCSYLDEDVAGENDIKFQFSIIGTLCNKTSVCAGYMQTYKYIMDLLGIPCENITGGNHGWNQIYLNGNWYHVDCTWDDPVPDTIGYVKHARFLGSDAYFADPKRGGDHVWNKSQFKTCSDTTYDDMNLFYKNVYTRFTYSKTKKKWFCISSDGEIVSVDFAQAPYTQPQTAIWHTLEDVIGSIPGRSGYNRFSSLIVTDQCMYYHTLDGIYQMDFDGNSALIYAPSLDNGSIYGMDITDGKLRYVIRKSLNSKDQVVGILPISDTFQKKQLLKKSNFRIKTPKNGFVYTGKNQNIVVTVDRQGAGPMLVTFENDKDKRTTKIKNMGIYDVYVETLDGSNYYAFIRQKIGTVKIVPKPTKLKKLSSKDGSIKVDFKKSTQKITGYTIRYSTRKSMKNAKYLKVKGKNKKSGTIKNLSQGKKYYVQIRTYYKKGKTDVYSEWSSKKSIKVK